MAARVIEAKAIFSAQDRSGNTFAFVAKKVQSVEEATKSAQKRIDAFNKANSHTSRLATRAEAAVAATSHASGLHHLVMAATTAVASGVVAHQVIHEGAKRLHERVRMEASGMADSEIAEATRLAAKLSSEFKPVNQTETMHMVRNARAIVGSYTEAAEIMEPLMKLRVIAQANRPGQDVSEDFDQLVKGLEIKGVTQNPGKFQEYMEGIAKGLNVFGDTLKPYQYYEMFKYGRQATPMLSEKFILSTAPTLAQELGGSSYGNAVSGFNRAIVAGRMEHSSLQELYRLGLVHKEDLDFMKTGEIKGLKKGKSIQGWQLAQSDPNEWVKQYFIPAMQKMGITGGEAMMKEVGIVFSNRMAAQLVGILATQQSRIEKDAELWRRAPGLAAAQKYMREDFSIAVSGFKSQLENLAAAIGDPLVHALTPAIDAASTALGSFARKLQDDAAFRLDHPNERTQQEKDVQKAFNRLFFDVDSDQVGSNIPDTAWRDRDLAAKREALINASSPAEEKRLRAAQRDIRRNAAAHPILTYLGVMADPTESDRIIEDKLKAMPGFRQHLKDLDWATLQRMLAEKRLRDNRKALAGTREPYYRLDRHGSGSVPPGLLTMPALPGSRGFGGGFDTTSLTRGAPPPVVAMPDGFGRPPASQGVRVGFDPLKAEITVKVDATSALLNAVADAKKATATTRAFTIGPDTGPGGLGETSTGQ